MNFVEEKWGGRGQISSIKIDQAVDGVESGEICKTALIDCIKERFLKNVIKQIGFQQLPRKGSQTRLSSHQSGALDG